MFTGTTERYSEGSTARKNILEADAEGSFRGKSDQ